MPLLSCAGACGASTASGPSAAWVDGGAPRPNANANVAPSAAARPPTFHGEGPFRFVFTDFHFEVGQQLVALADNGEVRDLFMTRQLVSTQAFCAAASTDDDRKVCNDLRKNGDKEVGLTSWHEARYTLAPAALAEARRVLAAARFETLRAKYTGSKGHDGTTRSFRLSVPGGGYAVETYSIERPAAPSELTPVLRWIRELQAAHAADRKSARRLTWAERDALAKELLAQGVD